MKKLLALLVLLAAPAFAQINIGNGGAVNIGSGSGGGGIPYPGAGIACSTGSAWCSAYSAGNQIPSSYLNLSAYLTTTSAASTYQPISSMSGYALLAGANFTGPVSMPSLTLNTTPLALGSGGTGATTAAGALANLGGVALTVVTLPDLSLPYSQLSGTVPTWNQSTTGNAATATNVTGTVAIANGGTGATTAAGALANLGGVALTVVTLPDLSLPYSQLSGTVPTWNQSTTGNAATATNVTGTVAIANGGTGATTAAGALANLGGVALTVVTLPDLSLPYSQLSGTVPTWNQSTTGNAATATNVTGTVAIANGGTGATTASGALANLGAQANLSLLKGTYVNGDLCTYTASGTLLNCNTAVPSVGTWGALNYPTWSSGTPFVKMTAAGTFALDTNTYLTSSGLSGMTTGQLPVAASATTVTSSIAYATANTASTIVERDGSGNFSAGTITAGTTTPTTMGSNGVLLNGVPALQSQTSLNNYYSGGAGNLTGTGSQNTANGYESLYHNTTGNNNTANGNAALQTNTTGSANTANGLQALYSNTTGYSNTANGVQALYSNTTGSYNTANGLYALNSNTTGSANTANGFQAGQYIADGVTANQTSTNSVYEGVQAYPLANGDTNENVIGNTAIGHGSNTTTLGNASITDTYIAGSAHMAGAAFTGSVTAPNVTDSALTPGNCVQAGTVGLLSTVSIPCYNLGGSIPTITLGAGAGTGGSFTEGGSDGSHNIFITVGSAPAANSLLWSATFTVPRSTYAYCIVSPNFIYVQPYLSLAQVPGVVANNVLKTGYTVYSGSVALTAGGTYAFEVSCP